MVSTDSSVDVDSKAGNKYRILHYVSITVTLTLYYVKYYSVCFIPQSQTVLRAPTRAINLSKASGPEEEGNVVDVSTSVEFRWDDWTILVRLSWFLNIRSTVCQNGPLEPRLSAVLIVRLRLNLKLELRQSVVAQVALTEKKGAPADPKAVTPGRGRVRLQSKFLSDRTFWKKKKNTKKGGCPAL